MAFWYQSHSHPAYKMVLAFNRDEDVTRPYKPVHYWDSNPDILAGFDIPSMGTWLGVNTETGNLAFLTNCEYLPWKPISGGIEFSRGYLITHFLELKSGVNKQEEYEAMMGKMLEQKKCYNGYNLVYTNLNSDCSYYINNYWEENKVVRLPADTSYALTNGVMFNDLYKASTYQNVLGEIISLPDNSLEHTKNRIFQLMTCQKPAPIDKLPPTLTTEDFLVEEQNSSIFVHKHTKTASKGERTCATIWTGIIILTTDNKLHFYERIYDHSKVREAVTIMHPVFGKHDIGVKDLSRVEYEENHIVKILSNVYNGK